MKMELGSCNTFVVLPPLTGKGSVIFGKNSNRPSGEVQELIYEAPKQCTAGEPVKCTYIEVEQVEKTFGIIVSKPAQMWGCEMGANDQGVVIGNESVWTKVQDDASKKLLGIDLVRLALERSKTAEESINVITELLNKYGQGGSSSGSQPDCIYHNSFLVADASEAWVLETAGIHWVAQKITSGYRNISSSLSIETQFDKSSPDVINFAKENGYWNGKTQILGKPEISTVSGINQNTNFYNPTFEKRFCHLMQKIEQLSSLVENGENFLGSFNFAAAFSAESTDNDFKFPQKYLAGQELLKKYTENDSFSVKDMFALLREKETGICSGMSTSEFLASASQVSVLSKKRPCCHWFTATPDPTISVFKPFIFTPNVRVSLHTKSSEEGDGRHVLYNLHSSATSNANNNVTTLLQEMERNCLEEVEKFLDDYEEGQSLSEVDELLKDVVETEVKFYK